jgi:hypothetical protein
MFSAIMIKRYEPSNFYFIENFQNINSKKFFGKF